MRTNIKEFNKSVDDFSRNLVPFQLLMLQKKIALEALRRIVLKTPVDRGRARGNWQVTINTQTENESRSSNPIGLGSAKILLALPFSIIYISNNVPYITVLEYGGFRPPDPGPSKDRRKGRRGKILVKGGYSVQAPQGMVGVTLTELNAMFP